MTYPLYKYLVIRVLINFKYKTADQAHTQGIPIHMHFLVHPLLKPGSERKGGEI